MASRGDDHALERVHLELEWQSRFDKYGLVQIEITGKQSFGKILLLPG
jgi:hypothetical protein